MRTLNIGSSANSENLSLTIKGAFIMLIPLIIIVAGQFGITLSETDLVQWVEALLLAVSGIIIFFGLCRKFYFYIRSKLR